MPRRASRPIFALTVAMLAASTLLSCGQPQGSSSPVPQPPAVEETAVTAPPAGDLVEEDVAPIGAPAAPSPSAAATTSPRSGDQNVEEQAPASAGRFVIERLDVDVPLRSFTPEGGVADPPTWDDVWVADTYGSPADEQSGTSILLVHSGIRESDAVGNSLLNRSDHSSTLRTGDVLSVDGHAFTVSSTHVFTKDEVEDGAEEVWLNKDGRLVLITCLTRPGERKATDVVVVVAQRSA